MRNKLTVFVLVAMVTYCVGVLVGIHTLLMKERGEIITQELLFSFTVF